MTDNEIFNQLVVNKDKFRGELVDCSLNGSHAFGLATELTKDVDLMGVYVAALDYYLGLGSDKETIEIKDPPVDGVFYELRKMVRLLLNGNPNVLSYLWVRREHVITSSLVSVRLRRLKHLFTGKHVYHPFSGYAYAQLKKMETRDPAELRQYIAITNELKFRGIHPQHKGTLIPFPDNDDIDLRMSTAPWKDETLLQHYAKYIKKGDNIGYLGDKRKKNVLEHGYDCYDDETTEFLTDRGWLSYDEVTDKDSLATMNIKTQELEYQKFTDRTDKLYSGKMYLIEPHGSRCFVTPNHNLLLSPCHRNKKNNYSIQYDPENSDWKLSTVISVLCHRRSHYHTIVAPKMRDKDFKIDDEYLKLSGAFLSEGSCQFRGDKLKSIRVTQSKPGAFHNMMDKLMQTYPIKKYIYDKEIVWSLHGQIAKRLYNDYGHYSNLKSLPSWCLKLSTRQAMVLFDAAMLGDGTEKVANRTYYCTSKDLVDNMQAMLVSSGIPCVVYGPYTSISNFSDKELVTYQLVISNVTSNIFTLRTNPILKINENPKDKEGFPIKEKWVYNQRVVCFEVPNGTLITRNGGKTAIHGNCKNSSHLIRLLKMCIEFLNTGELIVYREKDREELLDIKSGKWSLEDIKKYADQLFAESKSAYENSKLPEEPNFKEINKLLINLIMESHKIKYD